MIGAVIAMTNEAQILKDLMTIKEERKISNKPIFIGSVLGKEVVLIISGVGKVNAALSTQILIDKFNADKIINFGVAGGIKENTETTQVYAISSVVEYDFDLSELNNTKIGTPDELSTNYINLALLNLSLPLRKLATGDRFNDSQADYLLIKDYMEADVRDMEGAAVARTCLHAEVPAYIYKAISDKSGNNTSFEQYRNNTSAALENLKKYLFAIFSIL